MSADFDKLKSAIRAFQAKQQDAEYPDLMFKVFQAAYKVTFDGVSLQDRFKSLELPKATLEDIIESREARVTEELANYWRICLYLPECSRSHHREFANLRLIFVPSYSAEKWPPGDEGTWRYVHAEIQLLIYHEMSTTIRKPRSLPASKQPCFLCGAFIISYGGYTPTETHGDISPAWTVQVRGDDASQQPAVLQKIQEALKDTAVLLINTVLSPAISQGRTAPQSKINPTLDRLRAPSGSTIRSETSSTVSEQAYSRALLTPRTSEPSSQLVRADSGKYFGSDTTNPVPDETEESPQISKIPVDAAASISSAQATSEASEQIGSNSPILQAMDAGHFEESPISTAVDYAYCRGRDQVSWLEGFMKSLSSQLDKRIICSISAATGDVRYHIMLHFNNFRANQDLTLARPPDERQLRVLMKLQGCHDAILSLTWPD